MADYQIGEVVLLCFPFSNAINTKRRPALILQSTGDEDIVLAQITSKASRSSFDVELANWRETGLILPSCVRVHKLATLQKQLVERKLGALTSSDWVSVQTATRNLWSSVIA